MTTYTGRKQTKNVKCLSVIHITNTRTHSAQGDPFANIFWRFLTDGGREFLTKAGVETLPILAIQNGNRLEFVLV